MSRWAYFSARPEAKQHLFEETPWYALMARTKCGVDVYTAHLQSDEPSGSEKSGRPRCVHCIEVMIGEIDTGVPSA